MKMKKVILIFISIFFSVNVAFGLNTVIENTIYGYFNAVQSKDINWIKSNFTSFDNKRLQLYTTIFKSIDQKFSNISIEKIKQYGNKALIEVKSKNLIISKANHNNFEENSDLIFLLEKRDGGWRIAKITPYEDFDIIVKSYFLKKFANPLHKEGNITQKIGYNTAESGENFLDSKKNYIGCYKDQGDPFGTNGRDLNGYKFKSNKMTPKKCINICSQKGFKYAGVQYSSYCFCGNSYGKYGKTSNCNMKCSGNQNQICGGSWANSVYRTTVKKSDLISSTSENIKIFNEPRLGNYRLDLCKVWGTECGKPAADAFCRLKGYKKATRWEMDPDIGAKSPTKIITTGQICNQSFCDGFKFIECTNIVKKPNVAGGNYIGCFKDQWNRDLNGYMFQSNSMTPQKCINVCSQRGYKYAGVQYSSQCFCGNSYGKYRTANNCNMHCSGNSNQICGGSWANSVYKITR